MSVARASFRGARSIKPVLLQDPLYKGVNGHAAYFDPTITGPFVAGAAAAGVKAIRVDVNWNQHEPTTKGSYNTQHVGYLDSFMAACAAVNIDVLLIPVYCPPWANAAQGLNFPPTDPTNFADFCEYLVRRYPQVKAVEVWNEPDLSGSWSSPSASAYVSLLAPAYARIKSVNPAIKVLSPSLSNTGKGSYLTAFYAAGGKAYCDVISAHMYNDPPDHGTGTPEQLVATWIANIFSIITASGDAAKEIWITEAGWNTCPTGVSEATQANYLTRIYAAIRAQIPTCTRFYWYQFFDPVDGDSAGDNNFGVTHLTFASKQALAALAAVPLV